MAFLCWTKGRPQHYPRMRDEDIAALPIASLAHPDGCNVFLWVTSPKMRQAFFVVDAWGTQFSGRAFVWVKTTGTGAADPAAPTRMRLHTGQGYTTRKNAEDCWLLKFGRPRRLANDVHEVIVAPRREHSRKPDEAYHRIERFSAGPRADLFSRQSRPGWDSFGLEAGKFDLAQKGKA